MSVSLIALIVLSSVVVMLLTVADLVFLDSVVFAATTTYASIIKDRKAIWKIGFTHPKYKVETVVIEENEVIVGIVARLSPGEQFVYTNFQFQISKRLAESEEKIS